MFTIVLFNLDCSLDVTTESDYEKAMDIAEEWDCDGDHDGVMVVDVKGRNLYSIGPCRFDASRNN